MASCASTPRSTIIRLPSGARPAQSAAPEGGRSAVGHPPCRVGNSGRVRRVAPPRLRGVLGLATVRRAGAFRRLHPRILAPCFVAGIPASSPDAGFAAHPPPRVRSSHSAQHELAPPAPHLPSFFASRDTLIILFNADKTNGGRQAAIIFLNGDQGTGRPTSAALSGGGGAIPCAPLQAAQAGVAREERSGSPP